jgi:nitrogen fixation protein FixH
MALVFLVNAYMVYDAFHTFPGTAGTDGFDLSNEYRQVLATARQQAALGWQVEATDAAGHYPTLHVTDRTGAPLAATSIDAHAERPVGPAENIKLSFRAIGDGRYQADAPLIPGQWDIMLSVHADDRLYSATRRLIVR